MAQVLEVVLGDIGTILHPCFFSIVCLCVYVSVCVCMSLSLYVYAALQYCTGLSMQDSGILQNPVSLQ